MFSKRKKNKIYQQLTLTLEELLKPVFQEGEIPRINI